MENTNKTSTTLTNVEDVLEIKSSKMVEIPTKQITKGPEEIIEEIIDWFRDNDDDFISAIEELDGWNGYLNDDRIYDMWELDDMIGDLKFSEALEKIDTSDFNLCDDYFYYSIYGIRSTDYKDYSDYLDEYFVEALEENRPHIWAIEDNPTLSEYFDELTEARQRDKEQAQKEYTERHGAKSIKLMPGQPPEICYLLSTLKDLQNAVSDHGEPSLIEYSFPFPDSDNMILGNEEAKLIHMEPNRIINGELYCGPIYIVRDDNYGNLIDVPEADINKYLEMFKDPTPPTDEEIEAHFNKAQADFFKWF